MKLTILEKPGLQTERHFKTNLENSLRILVGELKASATFDGFSKDGWTTVNVDGPDSEVLSELISRSLCRAQTEFANIESAGVYEGIIDRMENDGIIVDIGVATPKHVNVRIGIEALRAQLADGKALRGSQIARDYCLLPGNRTSVRISTIRPGDQSLEGWLADSEIVRLTSWIGSRLERILVTDCFHYEVENAVRKASLQRDVLTVEGLTLTTQVLVSKLGTNAVGLIPKIGAVLRKRELNPFVPERILARYRQW